MAFFLVQVTLCIMRIVFLTVIKPNLMCLTTLSEMMNRRNGKSEKFQNRRNGSRRNGRKRIGANHRRNRSSRNGSRRNESDGVFPFRLLPFCLLPFCLLSNFTLFPFRLQLIFAPAFDIVMLKHARICITV